MTKKRYISDEDRLMMDTTVKWTSSAIIDNGPKNIENFLLKGELEKDFIIKNTRHETRLTHKKTRPKILGRVVN